MREDDKGKYFNPRILSQHTIPLPINVDKFLEQERPPVQTFTLNLQRSVRGQEKEQPAAVLGKRSPAASGPGETNTGYGIVHQEYKSSPE